MTAVLWPALMTCAAEMGSVGNTESWILVVASLYGGVVRILTVFTIGLMYDTCSVELPGQRTESSASAAGRHDVDGWTYSMVRR